MDRTIRRKDDDGHDGQYEEFSAQVLKLLILFLSEWNMLQENEMHMDSTGAVNTKMLQWVAVAFLVYAMLLAVGMIGSGFKTATGGQAKELFAFASNPFLGLIIGTVCTALIQSSSTVTSIIVGLVAGGLPVGTAIPMIMGANIGTTITNTLVSMGHVRDKQEFRRAFEAATVHDFFNLFAVMLFLPLEIMTGVLEKVSNAIAQFMAGGTSMSMKGVNFIKPLTKPVIGAAKNLFSFLPAELGGIALIIFGVVIIFMAITYLGKLLRRLMVGRAREILHAAIGRNASSGIFSGALVTVLVQSSSTTTSLMVPLVGSGVFTMRDIYPFTLGANIGTCVTALLAATAVSGAFGVFALQIALVHLLYNTLAVAVIFGIGILRELPPRCAEWLAGVACCRKRYAISYVLGAFFVFPAGLIYICG